MRTIKLPIITRTKGNVRAVKISYEKLCLKKATNFFVYVLFKMIVTKIFPLIDWDFNFWRFTSTFGNNVRIFLLIYAKTIFSRILTKFSPLRIFFESILFINSFTVHLCAKLTIFPLYGWWCKPPTVAYSFYCLNTGGVGTLPTRLHRDEKRALFF